MKTKAQELGITEFPYGEFNNKGNQTYYEHSNGTWFKSEYNENGNRTYTEWSDGTWYRGKFDMNGNEIYYEDNDEYIEYFII